MKKPTKGELEQRIVELEKLSEDLQKRNQRLADMYSDITSTITLKDTLIVEERAKSNQLKARVLHYIRNHNSLIDLPWYKRVFLSKKTLIKHLTI